MAKFLIRSKLTEAGLKGTLKEGGTKRKAAVENAVKSLGGKLEAFYYAFGEDDVIGIGDLPDNISAAAFSLLITASGASLVSTTVLITPEEMDQICQKTVAYRPPGQ